MLCGQLLAEPASRSFFSQQSRIIRFCQNYFANGIRKPGTRMRCSENYGKASEWEKRKKYYLDLCEPRRRIFGLQALEILAEHRQLDLG